MDLLTVPLDFYINFRVEKSRPSTPLVLDHMQIQALERQIPPGQQSVVIVVLEQYLLPELVRTKSTNSQ